jgi:hypothetical protein
MGKGFARGMCFYNCGRLTMPVGLLPALATLLKTATNQTTSMACTRPQGN